jgi:hypothetical protein
MLFVEVRNIMLSGIDSEGKQRDVEHEIDVVYMPINRGLDHRVTLREPTSQSASGALRS